MRVAGEADSSVIGFIASYKSIKFVTKASVGQGTYDVDVTQLVQPEIVDGIGGSHEVPVSEALVDFNSGNVELVEDPLFHEALIPCRLSVPISRDSTTWTSYHDSLLRLAPAQTPHPASTSQTWWR